MKILQVTPRYPPHTGGVETQVKEVSERLVERDHEITVVTADRTRKLPARERRNGVRVRRFRSLTPQGAFYIAPQLYTAIRRTDLDIVHAHNYHAFPLLFASLGAKQTALVATTYYHAGSAHPARDRLLDLYRPLGEYALGRTNAITAVSNWERDALVRDFGVDAEIIPIGIECEQFRAAGFASRSRPYVLCVARLEPYKGVQYVVRALPLIEGYDLLVAGDGPYRDTLEKIAVSAGVADRVSFLGDVAHEQLPALYRSAAVHVTLSYFESYGLTVAESLASGTPCVVRNATGLSDWTRRSDCVGVADTDPETLRDAVTEAVELTAPTEEIYSWNDVVDSFESLYKEVISSGKGK